MPVAAAVVIVRDEASKKRSSSPACSLVVLANPCNVVLLGRYSGHDEESRRIWLRQVVLRVAWPDGQ